MKRSAFPRSSVLPHIDYTRRQPLRAVGLFTALGFASAIGYALGLAAAIGLGSMVSATFAQPAKKAAPAAPAVDPSKFILNALLVPALDPDAVPPRWVDPRPRLRCGPGTVVRVNGAALRPGAPVPETPFDLDWWADECYPFGLKGPRFDGGARLTVYPEDWGYSATIVPNALQAAYAGGERIAIRARAATYPQCIESDGTCR